MKVLNVKEVVVRAKSRGIGLSVTPAGTLRIHARAWDAHVAALDALHDAVVAELQGREHHGCAHCSALGRLVGVFWAADAGLCAACCVELANLFDSTGTWPAPALAVVAT